MCVRKTVSNEERSPEINIFLLYHRVYSYSYSSKRDIFFIKERFNKLITGTNTIIKCDIGKSVKFHLVSRFLNGSKKKKKKKKDFYRISELMLGTFIQSCDKNHFIYDPVQERATN